jgi:hypothetical protein
MVGDGLGQQVLSQGGNGEEREEYEAEHGGA